MKKGNLENLYLITRSYLRLKWKKIQDPFRGVAEQWRDHFVRRD